MRAFIVRPFGTQKGIDFDRVERDLIKPALAANDIEGGTTEEIAYQGNIRADMFQRLLTADLVIVDISIHNANVFYEMGMRHAFRDRMTFLVRCRLDDVPFNLRTDRYLSYSKENPSDEVEALTKALRDTLNEKRTDSPAFQLVPGIEPQSPSNFIIPHCDFLEAVELAETSQDAALLSLLSIELKEFPLEWAVEGHRSAARSLFNLRAFECAYHAWERVRQSNSDDIEANLKLGTVFQRLGRINDSSTAITRVLSTGKMTDRQRAELYALIGSNAKTLWRQDWESLDQAKGRECALSSAFLQEAIGAYQDGFAACLNHYYSGINLLALQVIQHELAEAHPEVWADGFDDEDRAQLALSDLAKSVDRLTGAVRISVDAAEESQRRSGKGDPWIEITKADLAILSGTSPQRVKRLYQHAIAGVGPQNVESTLRQLRLLERLGVRQEAVQAAITAFEGIGFAGEEERAGTKVILFTGHRLDAPDRAASGRAPRFPAEAEAQARGMIRTQIEELCAAGETDIVGMAGGASGGDILFHEICQELEIPTTLLLAAPRDYYIRESVQDAGGDWVGRFDAIHSAGRVKIMQPTLSLPSWLQNLDDYSVWQRNNLWCLQQALLYQPKNVCLIALWNGKEGDGPGGTKDMIEQAKYFGARVERLDAIQLVEDRPST